jgi:hypothetical protein
MGCVTFRSTFLTHYLTSNPSCSPNHCDPSELPELWNDIFHVVAEFCTLVLNVLFVAAGCPYQNKYFIWKNISRKHSNDKDAALMWGSTIRFNAGTEAVIYALWPVFTCWIMPLFTCLNTVIAVFWQIVCRFQITALWCTLYIRIRKIKQLTNLACASIMFWHCANSRTSDLEKHRTQVHNLMNVNITSSTHNCRSNKKRSMLHFKWIQSVCAKFQSFFLTIKLPARACKLEVSVAELILAPWLKAYKCG